MSDSEKLPARAARPALLALPALLSLLALLAGCTPYQLRSILDGPKGMALRIDPASTVVPAAGTVDFEADGGVPPYTFSIVPPIGGTLDADTGVYTAPVTAGSVVIRVTDSAGRSADATVTVQTFATGLTLVPLSPIAVGIGSNVTFTAIGGTPPYSWSFSAQGSGSPALTGVVDPNSRLYTTGASAGLDRVMVTDSGGSPAAFTDINVSLLPSTVDYTIPLTSFPGTGTVGAAVPAGSFTLRNSGSGTGTQAVSWELYLSPNASLDSGDTVIGTGPGVTLAGATQTPVSISGTFPGVAAGTYYLLARVYAGDNVSSVNDISGPSMVTLSPADIDYIVTVLPTSTGGAAAGAAMSGTFTMRNDGAAGGQDTLHWAAYASADTALGGDYLLARGSQAGGLTAATSLAVPFGGMWPSTPGSWYLIVTLSADDDVDQSAVSNTAVSAATVTTTGPAPANVDYIVTSVTNTGGFTAGDPLTGSFLYRNNLGDAGSATVYWTAYISSNNTLDIGTDPVIDSWHEPWLPGLTTSAPVAFGGTWPALDGTWYLIVAVSATDENDPFNNERATGSSISTNPPTVNYTAVSITNTGGLTAGGPFSGSFVIQNVAAGGHDGAQFVPWTVYRSEGNGILDLGTDVVVAMGSLAAPGLAQGDSSAPIPFTGVWPSAAVPKTWYYIVHVGAGDDTVAGDNVVASPVGINVSPPDVRYTVPSVINTGATDAGGILSGQFSITNAGSATGTQPLTWTAYRSADNLYQVTDQVIATTTIGGVPGLGTSGPLTFTGTWPTTGGSWHLIVRISAADDTTTGDNETSTLAAIPLTVVAPNYAITAVPVPAGSTAGQAVGGTFTIQNAGPGAGTSPVAWSVYASLGNGTWDAGDTLIDAGSTGLIPASGSESPGYGGNWPSAPGTYWIVVRASSAEDPAIADAPSSASVAVAPPPPPDYTVSFSAAMPWSGIVGTAMSLTGTCQLTIQNLSANPGSKGITWAVHLSTDNVLDGLDTLVQQGSVGALAGSGSTTVGYAGNWPGAPGNFFWLIASVHAQDDSGAANDVVPAPHVCAVGDYRYKEGIEDNSGTGPAPNPANDARTSNTGLNVPPYLSVGETLAIEGTMDAAGLYDTYKLTVAGAMTVSTCARWATGMDELDFHVWDNVTVTDIVSQSVGADSEPGAAWYNVTIPSLRPCYIGTWMYLAGNTSGSAGRTYVILVRGL